MTSRRSSASGSRRSSADLRLALALDGPDECRTLWLSHDEQAELRQVDEGFSGPEFLVARKSPVQAQALPDLAPEFVRSLGPLWRP